MAAPQRRLWADIIDDEANANARSKKSGSNSNSNSNSNSKSNSGSEQYVTREQEFKNCAKDNTTERRKYDLGKTTLSERISASQVVGLGNLIQSKGLFKNNAFLTYAGMEEIASVLCRWPRPRELAMVAFHENFKDMVKWSSGSKLAKSDTRELHYFRCRVLFDLEGDPPRYGDMIGPKGANLVALTRDNDLMYAWYDGATMMLYATDMKLLVKGVESFSKFPGVSHVAPNYSAAIKFSTSMKDFGQAKKVTGGARKPAARKPAARKPAARKPAARKPAARKPAAKKPAA